MNVIFKDLVKEEEKYWSNIFNKQIMVKDKRKFSSYWWEAYYKEISFYVNSILPRSSKTKILEAGSGSGKASILLGKNIDRTLIDISETALDLARVEAKKFRSSNISFMKGNIFNLPFRKNSFDLVWNIGVLEHYPQKLAYKILTEMVRVANMKGYIAVGVPNFSSGPSLKARLLKNPFLKFVPGFRFHNEVKYTESQLKNLLIKAIKKNRKNIDSLDVMYFGNPLPMEFPKFIYLTLGKMVEFLLPKNKFLIFVSVKLKD